MTSEAESFERFCADAHPRLVAVLAHHCGDRDLGEELAHEALIRAGRRWDRVAELESPIGWTYRVGVNLSRSWFRRRAAERRARARFGRDDHHEDEDVVDRVSVRAALGQLPERQREAVLLRHFLDLSGEEAAAAMETTPGNVRVLAHRGVTRLRTLLDLGDNEIQEVRDGP